MSVLNRTGNQSTVASPSLVRLSSPSPPDSPEEVVPARSASPPVFPEFIHLISSLPPAATSPLSTSIISQPLFAQSFQPALHGSSPDLARDSEGEGEGDAHMHDAYQRVHQLQFQNLGSNFKPIKRLPRPPAPDWLYPTPPNVRLSSSSNSPLPSSETLTSSSTLSLSKYHFPDPPHTHSAPSSVPTSAIEPHSAKLTTAPTTPTVIHYRGASFDLLNPHDSLRLSHIQTPPERDHDQSGYFTVAPSLKDLISEEMAHSERGTALPRTLFDDYSTAFESITKGNSGLKMSANSSANPDTILPAASLQVHTTPSQHSADDGAGSTSTSPGAHHASKDVNTPTRKSPLRRITRRIPSIRNFKRKDPVVNETQVMSVPSPRVATDPPRIGPQAFGRLTRELERAHTLTLLECNVQPEAPETWFEEIKDLKLPMLEDNQDDPSNDVPQPSHATFHLSHGLSGPSSDASDPSNGATKPSHVLGSDSYYADSTTGSNRPPSTVVGHHQTIAFGHKTGQLDYMAETVDLSSHPYEFAESSHIDPRTLRLNRVSNVASNQTDTRLSGIIRGIRSEQEASPSDLAALQAKGDLSQQPLVTEGTVEDDSLANLPTQSHEDEERRDEDTSGFSQFDFGLNQNSQPSETSLDAGPSWSSPESIPAPLKVASGPPPTTPLPPAPDSRSVEPLYLRNFFIQYQSDLGSNVTSYGDTRDLLHPEESEDFSNPRSNVIPEAIEGSVEDATTQANAHLSNHSELPFDLEIADAPTPITQHETHGLPRLPFSSDVSTPEIGRALTTANLNQAGEVGDVTEASTDIYHDGAYIDGKSLQVALLNVTPGGTASNGGSSRAPDIWDDEFRTDITIENHDVNVSVADQPRRGTYQNDSATEVKLSCPSTALSAFPGIWHIPDPLQCDPVPVRSRARSKSKEALAKASTDADIDTDDPDEWETVLEDSKQNLVGEFSNSTMGDYSRFFPNVRHFSATIHPAHSTFNVSRYRLYSPAGSSEPFMVPEYQYGPGSAFTHRNALTPPISAAAPDSGSSPTNVSQRSNAQRMAHQIEAHHPVGTGSPSPGTHRQRASPFVDTKLLSPDPNDDIVYEGVPLLSSQQASQQEDSFSKFDELGPNANLTGSFLGTGMRDTGSSLANSSSPPQAQYKPSPLAQVVRQEEAVTSTAMTSIAPQSSRLRWKTMSLEMSEINFLEEYNAEAQEIQTAENRHTQALKHKPRFLPNAPPQAHIRTCPSRDDHFGLQRALQSDVTHSGIGKSPQSVISGIPPPPSKAHLPVAGPNTVAYHSPRKSPVPAILDYEEDLIELDSLPSQSNLPRRSRLASRAKNTISKDTLRTQSTRYSMLVPSRYESSARTITPLRSKHSRSYTLASGHHGRQFSGSKLAELRLSRSEAMARHHRQAIEVFSASIRKKEEFWSNFILWALGWTAAVPLVVWGTNKMDPLMVWLTGVNGSTFTEQSKRMSLIVGSFFGILYCTIVAVLIPLGVTGVLTWS